MQKPVAPKMGLDMTGFQRGIAALSSKRTIDRPEVGRQIGTAYVGRKQTKQRLTKSIGWLSHGDRLALEKSSLPGISLSRYILCDLSGGTGTKPGMKNMLGNHLFFGSEREQLCTRALKYR